MSVIGTTKGVEIAAQGLVCKGVPLRMCRSFLNPRRRHHITIQVVFAEWAFEAVLCARRHHVIVISLF